MLVCLIETGRLMPCSNLVRSAVRRLPLKNTYKWLDYNDGVTRLKDLAFAGNAEDYGADSFRVIPQNATQISLASLLGKTYYYKLVSDKAGLFYCAYCHFGYRL